MTDISGAAVVTDMQTFFEQERSERELLVSLCQLMEEQLAELKHIRNALGTNGSVSSLEIKSSTRGVDIGAKSYAGSDVGSQVGPAVAAYFEAMAQVQQKINGGS